MFLVDQAVRASVHMTPEKFENAALFLRLRVPSTLFHHENGAFRKRFLNWRNFENTGFAFSCERKSGASRKRWHHDIHVISLTKFSSTTNPKWLVIVAFSNTSGVVWTENICGVFQSETCVFKFLRHSVEGAWEATKLRIKMSSFGFALNCIFRACISFSQRGKLN